MKHYLDIFETCLDRYAHQLPWGIYFYHSAEADLKYFGNSHKPRGNDETENYLFDTMREICKITGEYKRVHTETSQSGMVYIGVPLFIGDKIWAVLATYLCLGREGTWRRSLNRGPSVAETVELLKELGFILETHQQVACWLNPRCSSQVRMNAANGGSQAAGCHCTPIPKT